MGGSRWRVAWEFMEGGRCRRVVLDAATDGRIDRVWCEEGKVRCNTCERREGLEAVIKAGYEGWEVEESEEEEEAEMGIGFRAVGRAVREGREAAELRRQLEAWVRRCVACWLARAEEIRHEFDECPEREEY